SPGVFGETRGIALRMPDGPVYLLPALGTGTPRATRPEPPEEPKGTISEPDPRPDDPALVLRFPRPRGPWFRLPIAVRESRFGRVDGCEARMARSPGRAPGFAVAGEFRDVASGHPAGRRR